MIIENGRVLLPDGEFVNASVRIEDNVIAEVGESARNGEVIDAAGAMVLPGLVDIHGDAFERQIMPRPGVHIDPAIGFMETDRQLVANGITTAYHGITYSWEPGLRGAEQCRSVLAALEALTPVLACDTKVHLRWETYNLDAVEEVEEWLQDGKVDLLAFNDHTPLVVEETRDPQGRKLSGYTGRTGLTVSGFTDLVERVAERADEVPAAIERLAGSARRHAVAQLSHDDRTAEVRAWYHGLGCSVAEFPVTDGAADEAVKLGNPIVLGGPNVLRGGSHTGALNAADMVAKGRCDILASDYYYPSMMHAAFKLAEDGHCSFPDAWFKVSRNPARAAGLADRGEIGPGQRADLVVVDPDGPGGARAKVTVRAGTVVHKCDI